MNVDPTLTPSEITEITREAYLYAFPMLMGYRYGYATYLDPDSPAYRNAAKPDRAYGHHGNRTAEPAC